MDTADQTTWAGGSEMWLYWQDYSRPVQSDQLCSIGADMMSATSLSLSIYNLLLYGVILQLALREKHLFMFF